MSDAKESPAERKEDLIVKSLKDVGNEQRRLKAGSQRK